MARVGIHEWANLDDPARQGIQEIDYGGGQIGKRVQGGWQYGFRPDAYQDALSIDELGQQQQLQQFRSTSGQKVALDDKGALEQMNRPQTPAQQWNAQPAVQAPQPGGVGDLFGLLMQRAQQPTTVGRSDPNVRAQVDPATAQLERASRNYVDDVAERAGPLANIQGERRLAAERVGQGSAALESEVIGREIGARRDEIAQALSMWGGLLSDQQRMQLQRELAQIDAQLGRESLGLQRRGQDIGADQFLRELALREFDLNNSWDYNWSRV